MAHEHVRIMCLYIAGIVTANAVRSDICDSRLNGISFEVNCSNRGMRSASLEFPTNVTDLNLAYNFIREINTFTFKGLKRVSRLDLSHNNISFIADRAFEEMWSLLYLNLESNKLIYSSGSFQTETFEGLQALRVLRLNSNNRNVTPDLMYPSTSFIYLAQLETLNMDGLQSTTLDYGFFALDKLSTLVFSGRYGVCNMGYIEADFFQYTPPLQYLDMSYCNITGINNNTFMSLNHLVSLDLSGNTFVTLNDFAVFSHSLNSAHLRSLYLNNLGSNDDACSSLRIKHFSALSSSRLEVLELAENNIRSIEKYLLSTYLPKSLKRISLRNNIMSYGDHITEFIGLPNIQDVDLGGNLLSECSYIGFETVRRLTLADNHCYKLYPDYFTSLYSMKELILSNNFLGAPLSEDGDGKFFQPLRNLTRLEIQNNRMATLPSGIFKFLTNLQVLNLSRNIISEWTPKMDRIVNLSTIDLSHNFLTDLPEQLRFDLDRWSGNMSVFLSNNPLQCTCKNKETCQWIHKSRAMIKDYDGVSVRVVNGSVFPAHRLDSIILNLQYVCVLNEGREVIVVATVAVLLTVVLILVTLLIIYKNKWNLRFCYYKFKYRYSTVPSNCKYDAFISYAHKDSDFVHNIVKCIESEQDISICIHDRDFLPGVMISENIIDAIKNSNKTIIVLSENFLNSMWCKFELNAAFAEAHCRRGQHSLIFILLGMSKSELPRDVKLFADMYTCLHLPTSEDKFENIDSKIIDKLRVAMIKKWKMKTAFRFRNSSSERQINTVPTEVSSLDSTDSLSMV